MTAERCEKEVEFRMFRKKGMALSYNIAIKYYFFMIGMRRHTSIFFEHLAEIIGIGVADAFTDLEDIDISQAGEIFGEVLSGGSSQDNYRVYEGKEKAEVTS